MTWGAEGLFAIATVLAAGGTASNRITLTVLEAKEPRNQAGGMYIPMYLHTYGVCVHKIRLRLRLLAPKCRGPSEVK